MATLSLKDIKVKVMGLMLGVYKDSRSGNEALSTLQVAEASLNSMEPPKTLGILGRGGQDLFLRIL
ncbi:MAG: hypothetical protein COA42_24205 [Alteromonadaceae bacterium]|nr:MAG: hypothetical protein COA42_24205 [Alteromonadaceae bacterium]